MKYLYILFIGLALTACSNNVSSPDTDPTPSEDVTIFRPTIIATYPHDTNAFTQGLLLKDGFLYESTGRYGSSTLRKVNKTDGTVIESRSVDASFFAEGLAEMNGQLIQLTWQARRAFVYDFSTFEPTDTISYDGEGWGLTTDGSEYIMSNGSSTIVFRDENFAITRSITVTLDGSEVTRLNELEYINGFIYANVWQRDYIVQIQPSDGKVVGIIECDVLDGMSNPNGSTSAVLNGIAWDSASNHFLLTGKLWPDLYEVELREVQSSSTERQRLFTNVLRH